MSLRIITLSENSVLTQHGVQDGDFIHRVNEHKISARDELRLVYTIPTVEFEIKRGSKSFTIKITADEPGATVEDSEGEFFALLPQSTLNNLSSTSKPVSARWSNAPASKHEPSVESSDAEKTIMFVAWMFLLVNVIGGVFLIAQFGSEEIRIGSAAARTVWNVELIALVAISSLSSIFLVAFAAMLCHFKQHLKSIDEKLSR